MRITCPNCDAQYEVDDGAIPVEGRDVQCSNCGHAWFCERSDAAEVLSSALYEEPAAAEEPSAALEQGFEKAAPAEAPAPAQRKLDDAVLAVLKEEAARETAARKAEAQGLEMQGDLGLPPPVSAGVGSAAQARRAAREEGPEPTPAERKIAAMKGSPLPTPRTGARRDLLPDIEEINSTLKSNDSAKVVTDLPEPEESVGRSGFRSGFTLMVLVAVICAAVYVMAPKISEQIPGLAGTMDAYVAAIDGLRVMLDGLIRKATSLIQGLTG